MKASELIHHLEKLIKEHGDLPVKIDIDYTEDIDVPSIQDDWHKQNQLFVQFIALFPA
jgi:hypothetical protein